MNPTSASMANTTTTAHSGPKSAPTDTKVAFINGKAHPIVEGETMLAFLRSTKGPDTVPTL